MNYIIFELNRMMPRALLLMLLAVIGPWFFFHLAQAVVGPRQEAPFPARQMPLHPQNHR